MYYILGNYEKAETSYQEALAILEKVLGKKHPLYAVSLHNLGNLYYILGNYEKAETLYQETLAIREKASGKEHPGYAGSLTSLGDLYRAMGNYEKAEPLLQETLAILEKVLGKGHPDYAVSLHYLGNLYYILGNYEKAETLYQETLAILEKVLGKGHPDYAGSLNNLGDLYSTMGNYEKTEPLILEANDIIKALVLQAYRHLSERELSTYIQRFIEQQDQFSSFAQIWQGLSGSSYNNVLFHKGFLLNAAQGTQRLAQSDSTSRELFLRHKAYLRRLAAEYSKPIAERQNVAELEEKPMPSKKS